MRIVGRLFLWTLLVLCSFSLIFFYFVYTPEPLPPALSGKLTKSSVNSDNLKRVYRLYVPKAHSKDAPLIVAMHGAGLNGAQMRIDTGYGFERLADKYGFVVAYPNAHEGYWNACNIIGGGSANGLEVDDVKFITGMIDEIANTVSIDPSRVFATGISRGGFMAFRLALEAPTRFRAVAAVSANIPTPDNFKCRPATTGTSSVMIMNGTEDPLVPFHGGEVNLFGLFYKNGMVRSSRHSSEFFAALNNIASQPTIQVTQVADGVRVERLLWRNDTDVEVELVAVHGGGHGIPQPYRRAPRLLGPSPREPNGPEEIWNFFMRQTPK